MTNQCDVEELKHQLLQKFYELAENPEEWEVSLSLSGDYVYKHGSMSLRPGQCVEGIIYPLSATFYTCELWADDRKIKSEKGVKAEYSRENVTKRVGWFRTKTESVERSVLVPNESQFIKTCRSLINSISEIAECKALEEALANVNKPKESAKESKPKRRRKEKDN